jgi:hypothetical protein
MDLKRAKSEGTALGRPVTLDDDQRDTVHQTYAPDGRKAYTLSCTGIARGWNKCMTARQHPS